MTRSLPRRNSHDRMKRRTFIKTLGLGASLPWLGHAALAAPDVAASHKILSCNVRADVAADAKTGDGWADRKELCADVMRAQRADVICLQECQRIHLQHLKIRLPEFDTFALSNPGPTAHPVNTIFFSRTRYELLSAGGFWLSEKPHVAGSKSWDAAYSRLVNWVQLKERGSGKELRVWNTHLDHMGQVAREKQVDMILQASAVFPEALPQFLTGDFNADADNPAIKLVQSGGWTDAYAAAHGAQDSGFTYHGFLGPKFAEQKKHLKRIDWIWCRGPVKVRAAEVIRESRNDHYPSDHYFMSATVTL